MLKQLVFSIFECNVDKSLIKDVHIVIVDNDIDKTAEITTNEIKEKFNANFRIIYHNYPIKGLSNVRNELLKKAFELDPKFIIFIDDDQYVASVWLNELVKTIVYNNGDMVIGPVISVFNTNISKNISCWFERPSHSADAQMDFIRTGNLAINADSLLKFKVGFDNRFNITGGEDTYFGNQLLKKGAKIFYAANAIAYETVPENRANIKWLITRWYRDSSTDIYLYKIEKEYLKILTIIFISLINIIVGILTIIFILIPFKRNLWGLRRLSLGIGGLTGLFDIFYFEYK